LKWYFETKREGKWKKWRKEEKSMSSALVEPEKSTSRYVWTFRVCGGDVDERSRKPGGARAVREVYICADSDVQIGRDASRRWKSSWRMPGRCH
jgi:hypothetical protein